MPRMLATTTSLVVGVIAALATVGPADAAANTTTASGSRFGEPVAWTAIALAESGGRVELGDQHEIEFEILAGD